MIEHAKIAEQIRAAFPALPIDAEGAFVPWGGSYPDARPYADQLRGKTWEQIDRAYLVRRSDALGFLSTPHLVAVLPVYLGALVVDGVWSPAAGILTVILAKPVPGKDTGLGAARFESLIEALTEVQRAAVAVSLQSLADADPDGSLGQAAHSALETYWKIYLRTGA